MKKVFLVFLSLCMLLCAAAAEEAPAEGGSPSADECLIRLWDRSGVECAYIRFALWQGDAQLGYVLSCPDEGEDFCRCPVYADQMKTVDGEPAEPLRIVLSFGYSEQEPEDAILSAMMGNPVTEEECCEMTLEPAFGAYLADELLQACRRKFYRPEYIACPGCGRTMYNLQEAFEAVKARTGHLKDVVIAVMGCIVNGPGEMADADWGYVGEGGGKVTIYRGKEPVLRHIPDSEAVDKLVELIESEQ